MFPLLLVALLIYTVATSLLLSFGKRGYRHLKDETVVGWVKTPTKGEGEVGEIIRYTQDEVQKLDEVHSRFSEVFASRLPFFCLLYTSPSPRARGGWRMPAWA